LSRVVKGGVYVHGFNVNLRYCRAVERGWVMREGEQG